MQRRTAKGIDQFQAVAKKRCGAYGWMQRNKPKSPETYKLPLSMGEGPNREAGRRSPRETTVAAARLVRRPPVPTCAEESTHVC
jgi:hypothetical protein